MLPFTGSQAKETRDCHGPDQEHIIERSSRPSHTTFLPKGPDQETEDSDEALDFHPSHVVAGSSQ